MPHRGGHVEPLEGVWRYFTWAGEETFGDLSCALELGEFVGLSVTFPSLGDLRSYYSESNQRLFSQCSSKTAAKVFFFIARTVCTHFQSVSWVSKKVFWCFRDGTAIRSALAKTVYWSSALWEWKSTIRIRDRLTNTPPSFGIWQLYQSRAWQRVE